MNFTTTLGFFILLIVITISFFIKYHWSRKKLYLLSSQLEGPIAYPLVGSVFKLLCKQEENLNTFLELTTRYSSPTRIWAGPKLVIVVKDPDQLQIILQSQKITTKANFYSFLEIFLGNGLLTASGGEQKKHKRIFQQFFSKKMIEGYSFRFQKYAKKFIDQANTLIDKGDFDFMESLRINTFEAVMDVVLEDTNYHSVDYKFVPNFIKRSYDLLYSRFKTFWLHPNFIFERTSHYKELMTLKKITTTMIEEVMCTTVTNVIKRIVSDSQTLEFRAPSVLEHIINIVKEDPTLMGIEECIDHMITLVAASYDTTNNAIAFSCMMLGAHPEKQRLVIEEIKEIIGSKKSLDITDISKMKYLEMCIKESMRLFPVIPFVFRDTTQEFQLGKYIIPENVTVAISIYHAHRDPKNWEKPTEFYPEHFSKENTNQRHPYAYIPFSAGPRKCIAQAYSIANLKIFIGTLLLHYEIECHLKITDIKLSSDIFLYSINGYPIKLKKRL